MAWRRIRCHCRRYGSGTGSCARPCTRNGSSASPMNEAQNISRTNFKYMYWSSVQQLVHHASSGCAMNVGDLLGSGTISGPEKDQRGSLLEISWNGTEPVELASGVKRTFLEDGD